MFKKKKTYIILVIIIVIIGSVFYFKNKKAAAQYTAEEAKKGTLAQTVSVTGKVKPVEKADIAFKASGRIESLYVDIGDPVKKGQKIAKIDKGTLIAQLNQAKADVAAQQQTLASMKRGQYKIEAENAQKELVNKYQASISAIQEQLGELVVYSPIDGVVTYKNYEVGENAVANSAVVTVSGLDGIEIDADVPESDIIKVALNQKADLTFDAFTSNDHFSATVTEIEPAATEIQDVVYYKVKLKLDKDEPRLKEGMSTDIDIKTAERNNVVFAPLRAVKTENGSKYVEILLDEKKGLTEKKTVTTGLEGDDGLVEIKSGLNGGEKVVTLTKTQ